MRKLFTLFLVVFVFSIPSAWADDASIFGPPEKLTIVTGSGEFEFDVEIAADDRARAQGLMFREEMAPKSGMLFDFGETQPVAMWMENTFIPLDMIFINPDGTVRRIQEDTEPLSRKIISSGGPISHVLELNAGMSRQIGLRAGDKIVHRFFKPDN